MNQLLDTPFLRQCREMHAWRIQWQRDNPLLLLRIRMDALRQLMHGLFIPDVYNATEAMQELIELYQEYEANE